MADNDFINSLNITQNIKFQMLQANKSCDGKAGGIGAILRMAAISLGNGLLSIYGAFTDQSTPKITGGIFSKPKNHAKEIALLEKKLATALQQWMTRAAYAHMLATRLQLRRFEPVLIPCNENGGAQYTAKLCENRSALAKNGGIGYSNFERTDLICESVYITDFFLNNGIVIDNNHFRTERTSESERRLEWIRPRFMTLANGTTIDTEDIKKRLDSLFKKLEEIDTRINAICVQRELSSPEKALADEYVQAELTRKLEFIAEEFDKTEAFFKGDSAKIIIREKDMTSNFLNAQKALNFINQQKEIAARRLSKFS